MERRLIDANAGVELLQRMAANYASIGRLKEAQDYAATANVLNSSACFPTIEAEPVRHGRWVRLDNTFTRWKCSECGAIESYSGYAYCHCGAKMDAKEDA